MNQSYHSDLTDTVMLASGRIFPNTTKGLERAEARLKRGNVQMYIPAEPLTEEPEKGDLIVFAGDTNVFSIGWDNSMYDKRLFDEGRAFEHSSEGVLGAMLKFQQLKNETKSWKKANNLS